MISMIPLITIFILSLIGCYVLVKCLKGTANINVEANEDTKEGLAVNLIARIMPKIKIPKVQTQVSGGIAAFVIVFGLLTTVFYYCEATKTEKWIISGEIIKENSSTYRGISVSYRPPSPGLNVYQTNGRFDLYNVKIEIDNKWPTLQFSCDGYIPEDYKISRENATINKREKLIILKKPVILTRIDQDGGDP